MDKFLEDLYEILFKPATGMRKVSQEKSIWMGLLVYLVVSILVSLSTLPYQLDHLLAQDLAGLPFPAEITEGLLRTLPYLGIVTRILYAPLFFFLWTAILHFTAEIYGGENRSYRLGAVLGYGHLPHIFMAPISLLSLYVPFDLVSLGSFLVFLWSLALKIIGLRETYNFSTPRALLCYLTPALVLILAFILFLVFAGAFLSPLLAEFLPA